MSNILLPGDAGFADVLAGKKFSAGSNFNGTGTMPNNGAVTITPGASNQSIPAGYHNGSGLVNGVTVPAANVLTGTTIAGTAGTMPNQGATILTPSGTGAVSIPAGYHNGSGSVSQVSVPAANVLTGTTIAGVAGTMPNKGAVNFTPSTGSQAIPAGYHNGSGVVSGDANLTAANIKSGVSIFGIAGSVIAGSPFASGTTTAQTVLTTNWTIGGLADSSSTTSGPTAYYQLIVSGLTFTPSRIIVVNTNPGYDVDTTIYNASDSFNPSRSANYHILVSRYVNQTGALQLGNVSSVAGYASITATGFTLPVCVGGGSYKWYAYA